MNKLFTRLDSYIIKKFLGTYLFAIALIISIAVVFDINEKMDKFIGNDAPLSAIIFDYYMNFIPYFANLFSSSDILLAASPALPATYTPLPAFAICWAVCSFR